MRKSGMSDVSDVDVDATRILARILSNILDEARRSSRGCLRSCRRGCHEDAARKRIPCNLSLMRHRSSSLGHNVNVSFSVTTTVVHAVHMFYRCLRHDTGPLCEKMTSTTNRKYITYHNAVRGEPYRAEVRPCGF